MKKLTGVQDETVLFDDNAIAQGFKAPTYGTLLSNLLNAIQPKNNEESAVVGQMLLKLRLKENEFTMENADYKLVMDKMNENPGKMYAGFHSQLLLWLQKFEKDAE